MKLFTFNGGVHPPYRKDLCNDKPITKVEDTHTVILPLVQHIGAPAEPDVAVGDTVKEGQRIGKAKGFVSASVHSPVSGKVKKIEATAHPLGMKAPSIIIEPDGSSDKAYMEPMGDEVAALDAKDVLSRIMDAGIVGLGGATFPTHVKFSPPIEKPIDTLIINGCECEPYLTADYRLMLERPRDLVLGSQLIGKVLGVSKIIVGIESNKPEAIRIIADAVTGDIQCMVTATKYPQGAEKMLIKALLGKEVPSGGLPMDVGTVVSNVGTAIAVCDAVRDGKPLIDRVVTVTGNAVKNSGNFLVKIGTPVQTLVDLAGGTEGSVGKFIMGGPMMGIAQYSLDIPVIKGMSGVLLLQEEDDMYEGHSPCIKCSFCVQACPVSLLPSTLSVIGEAQKWQLAEKYGVNDCIECGSCAYVCPSKRPIVQLIKTAKQKLREIKARENK